MQVTYMSRGATWSPAYDLRVDTETDSISCTYFGRVTQSTTEDWKGTPNVGRTESKTPPAYRVRHHIDGRGDPPPGTAPLRYSL